MKNFKLIFILTFILLIISMGCVSATDSGDIAVSDVAYSFDDSLNTQTVAVSDYSLESDDSTLVDDLGEDNVYADDIFNDSYSNSEDIVYDSSFSRFKDNSISSLGASKTSTKIVASDLTMSYYDGHKLIATIKTSSGKAIKGLKVTFKVNGVTYNRTSNASGVVVLGITNGITLAPGTYSCVIKFAGTSAYAASSKTVTVTVNKWGTKLSASNCAYDYGPGKLVATLQNSSGKGINGKSLSFTINGKTYTAKTAGDGKATLSLPTLDPGSYSCVIKYEGDKVNNTCSKTVTVTVNKWITNLVANNYSMIYNTTGTLVATLQNSSGKGITGKSLSFTINGQNYAVKTDSNGKATLTLPNLNPGTYSCIIKYSGDKINGTCSKTIDITVNKIPTSIYAYGLNLTYGRDSKILVNVEDYNGNILEGKRVYLIMGNAPRGVTDSEGWIGCFFVPGIYNSYFSFLGDDYYASSSKLVTYSISVASPIVSLDSGVYNNNLNVSINSLHGGIIYSSLDNGLSWNESVGSISYNLTEGNWTLKTYASFNGYNSPIIERNFIVCNLPLIAWSNYNSSIYNYSFSVELYSIDSNDSCPLIYYTCDGSVPTRDSDVYLDPIYVSNSSNCTVLRFFAVDKFGHESDVVSVYYFFGDVIANLNSGKVFSNLQDAIEDNDTENGDVIEISKDIFGSVNINKEVILKACNYKPIYWYGMGNESVVNIVSDNVVVDGFNFIGSNIFNLEFVNNCSILNNYVRVESGYGAKFWHCSFSNVMNNTFCRAHEARSVMVIAGDIIIDNNTFLSINESVLSFSEFNASDCVYNLNVNSSIATLKSNLTYLANRGIIMFVDGVRYESLTNNYGDVYLPFCLSEGWHEIILYSKGDDYYLSSYKSFKLLAVDNLSVSASYCSGFYNFSNLLVNFSSFDGAIIFCSFDNGSSWSRYNNSICYNLTEGVWDILVYCSLYGYNSSVFNYNYVVGNSSPLVWSNYGSGIYEDSFYVNLSSFSIIDDDVLIYYTLDGSLPTTESLIYNYSLFVSNQSTSIALRFFASDKYGHSSDVVSIYYFFGNVVVNLNNGGIYNSVQSAIDDDETSVGDVIEVSCDLNGSVVLSKGVYLRACGYKSVLWDSSNCSIVLDSNDSIIEGFRFVSNVGIDLNGCSNIYIINNYFDCSYCDIFNQKKYLVIDYDEDEDYYEEYYLPVVSYGNIIMSNVFEGSKSFNSLYLDHCYNLSLFDNYFNLSGNSNGTYIYSINSSLMFNKFYNCNIGLLFSGFDCNIANNSFFDCYDALYLINYYNNWGGDGYINVLTNSFVNNYYAVYVEYGFGVKVNFNSIINSSILIDEGHLNAVDNWWGTNNESVVLNKAYSGGEGVIYVLPYLVLSASVSSYKIVNGSVYGATICADLKHDMGDGLRYFNGTTWYSYGYQVYNSSIYVPDGLVVNFDNQSFGVIHDGVAYGDVTLGSDDSVCVYLDDGFSVVSVERESRAQIVVFSSAIDVSTNESLYYSYDLVLNDSIDWFTCVWRYKDDFESEVDLIVNGEIINTFIVDSSFYIHNLNNIRSEVLSAVALYNDFLYNEIEYQKAVVYALISLDYSLDTLDSVEDFYFNYGWGCYDNETKINLLNYYNATISDTLLNLIKNSYDLSDDEVDFIRLHHDDFRDDIYVALSYLGGSDEIFGFSNDNGSESLVWYGSSTLRSGVISYVNGAYAHEVGNDSSDYYDIFTINHSGNDTIEWYYQNCYGYYSDAWYDGLMTFTFANTKVDNNILQYWLSQKNRTDSNGTLYYNNGFMKAAFGSFLEGLLVVYCDDLVADVAAERFNVTWERTSPMVMSVRDDNKQTILSGECSFYFGRTAYGDVDAVKAFYFACSASFSPIEHYVAQTLFPGSSDLGSVTTGLGYLLNNGSALEIIFEGSHVLIREFGSNERVLVFDNNTGLLHDQIQSINGAFCYSNQQTEWASDLANELLSKYNQIINYLKGTNINLDGLNVSTVDLLKSCNGMLGIAGLFVSENSEVILAALPEMGGLSLGLICGVIIAPIVAICEAKPVGEPDGSIEEFYKTHPNWTVRVSPTEVNQIGESDYMITHPNERALAHGINNGFILSNSGSDGDNGSFIKKLVAIGLISMVASPFAILAIDGIKDASFYIVENNKSNNVTLINVTRIKPTEIKP